MKGRYLKGTLQLCWGRPEEAALPAPLSWPVSGPVQPPAWPDAQPEAQPYSEQLQLSHQERPPAACWVLAVLSLDLLKGEERGAQASGRCCFCSSKARLLLYLNLFTSFHLLKPPSSCPSHHTPPPAPHPSPFKKTPHLDSGLQLQQTQLLVLLLFPPSVSSSAVSFPSEAAASLPGSSPSLLPETKTWDTALPPTIPKMNRHCWLRFPYG